MSATPCLHNTLCSLWTHNATVIQYPVPDRILNKNERIVRFRTRDMLPTSNRLGRRFHIVSLKMKRRHLCISLQGALCIPIPSMRLDIMIDLFRDVTHTSTSAQTTWLRMASGPDGRGDTASVTQLVYFSYCFGFVFDKMMSGLGDAGSPSTHEMTQIIY